MLAFPNANQTRFAAGRICAAARPVGPLRLDQSGLCAEPGAGGPCFQWTRKVKGKTVSVALSQEQYQALQAAIVNWKEAQAILRQMQTLSRAVIFGTLPHPPRRKRLGKKVLGLI